MNRTARLCLILLCGALLLAASFIYPQYLLLWQLCTLLALLIGMLLLYPAEKTRHLSADSLEQERARLEAAINCMTVGFMVIDANHNLITLNARAQSLLHVIPPLSRDFFYKNLPIISEKFTMQKLEDTFAETIDLKGMIDTAILQKKPLEERDVQFGEKYLHIMLSPIIVFKKKPEAIGCVMLIEDATDARALEKSRDEFFSIASHELRTPLTAIRGNVALIQQYFASKVSDERFTRMLSDIHESSKRLISIVDDFLDSSRLEQGRIKFAKDNINIGNIISYLLKEYQVNARQKNIELVYKAPGEPVVAVGDEDKIKQILINMLGNSLKHTQSGSISFGLEEKDNQALIRITDTGSGMSGDVQKKLFTKFQKNAQAFAKDTTRGSGLGLYISKLLAEGMGGSISLEKSEVGKGSTFVLKLPKAE